MSQPLPAMPSMPSAPKIPRTGLHTLIAGAVCLGGFTAAYFTIFNTHHRRLASDDTRKLGQHEHTYRLAANDDLQHRPSTSTTMPTKELKPIVRERDNHHYTLDMGKNPEKTQPAPQRGVDGIAYTKAPSFRGTPPNPNPATQSVREAQRDATL